MQSDDMWDRKMFSRYDQSYIKAWLYNERCQVTFMKLDGTQRVMNCTLSKEFLPEQTDLEEAAAKSSKTHCTVWDLDKKEWRSFIYDRIVNFQHENSSARNDYIT